MRAARNQHHLRTASQSMPGRRGGASATMQALMLGAAMGLALPVTPAWAQQPPAQAVHKTFNVPAGALEDALNTFARQAGITLSFDPALVQDKRAVALVGSYDLAEALRRLLSGSDLVGVIDGATAVVKAPPRAMVTPAETSLPVVTVTGRRDTGLTTEFTRKYTSDRTSIGRGELSVREIPQSVSVVTRPLMNDQNAQTLGQAMQMATGIVVVPYGNGVIDFTARGFQIDQYQFDGLSARGAIGSYSTSSFDTALFDRIEVLRGAAGLLQGAGEPAGTINMVRKRAQKDFTVAGALSAGSWNAYRGEVDVTGGLAQDGRLRGRFVAVRDTRDSYIDLSYANKSVLYGTLEFDVTPSTTLSAGVTDQRGTSMPNYGLPTYTGSAGLLNVSRSTFLGDAWNKQKESTTRYFADLEHRLDNGGQVRLAWSHLQRDTYQATSAFSRSQVNPATGNLARMEASRLNTRDRDEAVDAYVSTPFEAWGLQHNVLLGVSFRDSTLQTNGNDVTISNNIYNHVPVQEPVWDPLEAGADTTRKESSTYGQLRLKVAENATIVAGGRVSWWDYSEVDSTYNTRIDGRFTPYGGLIFDLSPSTTVYASYASIYKPQADKVYGGGFVKPRQGDQYEVGIKQAWLNGRLNGQAALFQITDKNRSVDDPSPDHVDPNGIDYYSVPLGKVRSEGLEAELSGRVTQNWDLVAGYAFTSTKYLFDLTTSNIGLAVSPGTPRNSVKLWSNHKLPQGWSAGLGVVYASRIYAQSANTRWEQGGVTTASARVGYQINRNLDIALNASNLFDKTYYARISGGQRQNYYAEPRNVTLTLRACY